MGSKKSESRSICSEQYSQKFQSKLFEFVAGATTGEDARSIEKNSRPPPDVPNTQQQQATQIEDFSKISTTYKSGTSRLPTKSSIDGCVSSWSKCEQKSKSITKSIKSMIVSTPKEAPSKAGSCVSNKNETKPLSTIIISKISTVYESASTGIPPSSASQAVSWSKAGSSGSGSSAAKNVSSSKKKSTSNRPKSVTTKTSRKSNDELTQKSQTISDSEVGAVSNKSSAVKSSSCGKSKTSKNKTRKSSNSSGSNRNSSQQSSSPKNRKK
ncbi:hypothetical protein RDWZM_000993 [Blomia tropicalis]|uniref:Uncharacterized protein n=1 Tax=Blomia tropicalis TaxID=40697 RepID=A0A9Q0MBZ8_BLOTA|nr:hypothetical protein RDWZM_000993 [Blomia tropicalis]